MMTLPNPPGSGREAVAEGLMVLFNSAFPFFKVIERGYRPPERVAPPEQPYLGLVEGDESYPGSPVLNRPRFIDMEFMAVIYCTSGVTPPDPALAKQLNGLIDILEIAIAYPDRFRIPQNLGIPGVLGTRVQGTIIKDPGYLNGKAKALIPIYVRVSELALQFDP